MALELDRYEDTRDRAALVRLAAETVRDGTVYPFEAEDDVLAYFLAPGGRVVVAREDGEVVGAYVLKPNQPGRGAHVANAGYVVAEDARGRGVGRRLAEHSLALARDLAYRAVQFNYVVSTNTAAVRLWRSLGFDVVAELPGAFRHPELGFVPVFVMFREVREPVKPSQEAPQPRLSGTVGPSPGGAGAHRLGFHPRP